MKSGTKHSRRFVITWNCGQCQSTGFLSVEADSGSLAMAKGVRLGHGMMVEDPVLSFSAGPGTQRGLFHVIIHSHSPRAVLEVASRA